MTNPTIDIHGPELQTLLRAIRAAMTARSVVTMDQTVTPEEAARGLIAEWQTVGVSLGPRVLSLWYVLEEPARDLTRALSLPLSQYVAPVLGYRAGERCPVRIQDGGGGYLQIELPSPVPWQPGLADLRRRAAETILLGFDRRGLPLHIDLYDLQSGALVAGAPGAGKTQAMLSVVLQALPLGWTMALVDLKGGDDWAPLAPWARFGVAFDDTAADAVLADLVVLVNARNRPGGEKHPPVLLVVDELADLSKRGQETLALLARKGRSANVRVLAGSQRLGADVAAVTRQSLPNRLVGLCATDYESKEATGRVGAGAENLLGRGDMLWITPNAAPERVQAPLVYDPRRGESLAAIAARELAGVPTAEGPQPAQDRPTTGPLTLDAVMGRLEALAAEDKRRTLPSRELIGHIIARSQRTGKVPTQQELHDWSVRVDGVTMSAWKRQTMTALVEEVLGQREPAILAGLVSKTVETVLGEGGEAPLEAA